MKLLIRGPSAAASILSQTVERLDGVAALLVYVTKNGQMHVVFHERKKEKPMAKAKPKKKPKPRY